MIMGFVFLSFLTACLGATYWGLRFLSMYTLYRTAASWEGEWRGEERSDEWGGLA